MFGKLCCAGALGISGGEWSANWQVTRSTKCAYLLSRLRALGAAPPAASQSKADPGVPSGCSEPCLCALHLSSWAGGWSLS